MDILDFYNCIDSIKHTQRIGWKNIGVKGVKDTIASHSFGASLIAWVVAKKENSDAEKMIKMLLMHDLIMAYVKDYTPKDGSYKNKREIENQASMELLSSIPGIIKEEFTSLFDEYQEEKSELSVLARECDKLDTLFQSYMYSKRLKKDYFSEFLDTYNGKIKSKTGKEIINYLKEHSQF